jgi:hypothetical protein
VGTSADRRRDRRIGAGRGGGRPPSSPCGCAGRPATDHGQGLDAAGENQQRDGRGGGHRRHLPVRSDGPPLRTPRRAARRHARVGRPSGLRRCMPARPRGGTVAAGGRDHAGGHPRSAATTRSRFVSLRSTIRCFAAPRAQRATSSMSTRSPHRVLIHGVAAVLIQRVGQQPGSGRGSNRSLTYDRRQAVGGSPFVVAGRIPPGVVRGAVMSDEPNLAGRVRAGGR